MMLEAEEWAKQKGFNSFDLRALSERTIRFYREKCEFTGNIPDEIEENKFYKLKKIFKFDPTHFNYLHDVGF